ncbi:MAG: PilZ domain-containing protein [Mariprofundaceae bacterium]
MISNLFRIVEVDDFTLLMLHTGKGERQLSSKIKKPAQFEMVLKTLNSVLGTTYHDELTILARHICKEEVSKPLKEVLGTLYRNHVSVTQVLAALLKCESIRMHALFIGHASMPLHTQFEDLRNMIHDFNAIQDNVMEVGEEYLAEVESKNVRSLESDDAEADERISGYMGMSDKEVEKHRENVLLASMLEWKQTGRVRMFNVYRGLPVNASTDVLSIEGETIRIALDRDIGKVFASHPMQNRAYLSCAGAEDQVRVTITEFGRRELTLSLEDISPSFVGRRDNLGVQISENVPVELWNRNRRTGTVHLFDASITGLGFILQESDQTPYSAGDELECRFSLGSKDFKAHGWIRWLMAHEGGTRIGMELKADKQLQQQLQREIFRIQREIIIAINEFELPEGIRKALM